MANRSADWLRQFRSDLMHARLSTESGSYDWACFASHQATEKAVKATCLHPGLDGWGHTISVLLANLSERAATTPELVEAAKTLDKHSFPTRDPNGFDAGAPIDFSTKSDDERAVRAAEEIVEQCARTLDQAYRCGGSGRPLCKGDGRARPNGARGCVVRILGDRPTNPGSDVNLCIYTLEELAELARSSLGWYRTICGGCVVAGAMIEASSTPW